MLGYLPDELANAAELPHEAAHVWRWFAELHATRGHGQWGALPISHTEIAAWAALTDARPTVFEVRAIRAIDDAFLTPAAEKKVSHDDGSS